MTGTIFARRAYHAFVRTIQALIVLQLCEWLTEVVR